MPESSGDFQNSSGSRSMHSPQDWCTEAYTIFGHSSRALQDFLFRAFRWRKSACKILAADLDLRTDTAYEHLKPLEYVADIGKRTLSECGMRDFTIELLNQIVSSDDQPQSCQMRSFGHRSLSTGIAINTY
ncbi:hypothetical protein BTUL_0197g00070 [Botrytis tulipae]|uniref:Uncharacterized protein n=1 Tax=Botrytis tulipae TaxID=87230 RepID=A0A4Z1E8X4_9HELO|nr:hypothetical protein BTUL_0197g00070 [Botrytis tulipae]